MASETHSPAADTDRARETGRLTGSIASDNSQGDGVAHRPSSPPSRNLGVKNSTVVFATAVARQNLNRGHLPACLTPTWSPMPKLRDLSNRPCPPRQHGAAARRHGRDAGLVVDSAQHRLRRDRARSGGSAVAIRLAEAPT
jgi:hypothetical protein